MTAYYTYCIIHKTTQDVVSHPFLKGLITNTSKFRYSTINTLKLFNYLEDATKTCNELNEIESRCSGAKPYRVRVLRLETVPEIDPKDLEQFLKDKEKDEQLNYRPDI